MSSAQPFPPTQPLLQESARVLSRTVPGIEVGPASLNLMKGMGASMGLPAVQNYYNRTREIPPFTLFVQPDRKVPEPGAFLIACGSSGCVFARVDRPRATNPRRR